MKFYIIQNNIYEFENYIFIKSSKKNFIDNLKKIENESVILTDLFKDNNDILWFNNKHNIVDNEINKIIYKKKLFMFKLITKSVEQFHYLEFIKDIFSIEFNILNKNHKNVNDKFKSKLINIKNCIIVANGNKLCSNPNMIDSKDFVIRMNSARIIGFEDKVGKKTNMYFKGKTRGKPDFEGINFNDPNLISLGIKKFFVQNEKYWLNQPYVVKLNWYKLIRKYNFNYVKEPNFINKSKYSKKYKFNTSGQFILIFMLFYSIKFGFKLFTTGYDLHSEWKNFCYNNLNAMEHCNPNGHYYGIDNDNKNEKPQNMKEFYDYHNIEETRFIYKLLKDNQLIFDL
jgi:hypothetical protein